MKRTIALVCLVLTLGAGMVFADPLTDILDGLPLLERPVSLPSLVFGESVKGELSSPEFSSTRVFSMGGINPAVADGVYTLFSNPALLGTASEFQVLPLTIRAGLGNMQELYNGLVDGTLTGYFADPMAHIQDFLPYLQKGGLQLDLDTPLGLAYAGNGFGIGLFDRIGLGVELKGTTLDVKLNLDLSLNLGFAIRLLDTDLMYLDIGIAPKVFATAGAKGSVNITSLDFANLDPMALIGQVIGENLPVYAGVGVDAGVVFNILGLSVGLTADDIFTIGVVPLEVSFPDFGLIWSTDPEILFSNVYVAPMKINLGVAYTLDLGFISVSVAAGYKDVFALFADWKNDLTLPNPALNLSAGAEVELFDLVAVRAGLKEGLLPSVGVGLNLFIFKLDLAVYGKQTSPDLGQGAIPAVDVSFRFAY